MDRHGSGKRPEGESEGRYSRMGSRWSDGPMETPHQMRQPVGYYHGGAGRHGGYSERHHPYRGGPPHDYSLGGGRGSGFHPGPGGYNSGFNGGDDPQFHMGAGGLMRGNGNDGGRDGEFLGAGRREYPKNNDGSKITKLFIGSVPRTATEQEIRPLFEQHGNVIEVALIKDKRTGQQQGCCFVKYANSEDADRAIKFLHNQFTLPGGMGPIQVRYADGERERLGAVEHKLFVGSLNRQATEKEIEEIFSPYGCIEDVYIMRDESKQSRGCGFVKFSNRDNAAAAITALSGVFVMRGCEQPLIVRFADPKRPKPGESRGGLAFGGNSLGPRSQLPPSISRSSSNVGDPTGGQFPPSLWNKNSSESLSSSNGGAVAVSSMTGFSPPVQPPTVGQQISSLQKPTMSTQHLPPITLSHNLPTSAPYTQKPTMQSPMQQHEHIQNSYPAVSSSIIQSLPSQHLVGLGRQLPSSQHLLQQGVSTTSQLPLKTPQVASSGITPQQLRTSAVSQIPPQSIQRSPSPLVLQLQAQPLPSNFHSSQQTFTHLQPQLNSMQPSNLIQQQNSLDIKQLPIASTFVTAVSAAPHISNSHSSSLQQLNGLSAEPLTCSWSEHTSPEGFNYYYNSVTKESKWEKPEDLSLFEQKQQQQKLAIQHLQSTQQGSQIQLSQSQMQFRQQPQLQQLQHPSDLGYSRFQLPNGNQ